MPSDSTATSRPWTSASVRRTWVVAGTENVTIEWPLLGFGESGESSNAVMLPCAVAEIGPNANDWPPR